MIGLIADTNQDESSQNIEPEFKFLNELSLLLITYLCMSTASFPLSHIPLQRRVRVQRNARDARPSGSVTDYFRKYPTWLHWNQ